MQKRHFGLSHLLASISAGLIVSLPIFLIVSAASNEYDAWPGAVMAVSIGMIALVGIPTEYFFVSTKPNSSLGRAYGIYALTGAAMTVIALLVGAALTNGYTGMFSGLLVFLIAGVYVVYLPIMLIARGIFVPLERAFAKNLAKN